MDGFLFFFMYLSMVIVREKRKRDDKNALAFKIGESQHGHRCVFSFCQHAA